MKTLAILLLLVGLLFVLGAGLMYFFGFIMSFDAPGSMTDPKGWMMRILIFLPVLAGVALLIFGFITFNAGAYKKAVVILSVYPLAGVALLIYMNMYTASSMKAYQVQRAKEEANEKLYPVQKYMRSGALGTDTIIVWPNRIVAYRLHVTDFEKTWNGPLGDLNESRDAMKFNNSHDTRLRPEELDEFTDESGRRFTDVYRIE